MENEEIKLTEFDEKKFKEKERKKAKIYFVSFIFGIIMAILCTFFWINLPMNIRWPLCFLLGIASVGFLAKLFQIVKLDIKNFNKKDWISSIFYYFLTWLAFFILFINPPFYDASPPKIEIIALPELQQENGTITIFAHVTDNLYVKDVIINLSGKEYEMEKGNNSIYSYNISYPVENYTVIARDKNNNEGKYEGKVRYKNDLIKLSGKEVLNSSDEIEIMVYKNISKKGFRVFYKINGKEINATKTGEKGDYLIYSTSPVYEGWKKNSITDIEVFVEVIHYFPGINSPCSNKIYGGKYSFQTTDDEIIGREASPIPTDLPRPEPLRTPGFGIALLLIAFALFLRKKK
ncbi:MAG: hypothetical protein H5T44_03560 [Thermoplasmatales archaeon]|nr:hypothetical protein [Thermoplasmatales archaeon]